MAPDEQRKTTLTGPEADPQLAEMHRGKLPFDPGASGRGSGRWTTWGFVATVPRGGIESTSNLPDRPGRVPDVMRCTQRGLTCTTSSCRTATTIFRPPAGLRKALSARDLRSGGTRRCAPVRPSMRPLKAR